MLYGSEAIISFTKETTTATNKKISIILVHASEWHPTYCSSSNILIELGR